MVMRIPNPIHVTTQPAATLQSALGTLAFGGPTPYQVEAQQAAEAQRMAHALLYDEQTRKAAAERAIIERQGALRSEAGMDETAAAMAGVPVSGVRTYRDWLRGTPGVETMPPAGPALEAIRRADAALRTGMADPTVSASEIAKAHGEYGAQGIRNRAASGEIPMNEAAALLRLGQEAPYAEWGSKFTGTPSEYGNARTTSELAQADQRTAAAGRERAHAGLYGAQTTEQNAINRAGVGRKFGPPVVVRDPEAGDIYTAPGATAGRAPGAKPLDEATALLREEQARKAGVQADAGGFAPRGAGRPQQPVALPGGNATVLRMQESIRSWAGGNGLDPADRDLIVAAATNMATDPQSPFFRNPDGALEQIGREIGIESNTWSKNKIKDRAAFMERFPTARAAATGGAPAAGKPAPAATPAPGGLPPAAVARLREGVVTTFANGQQWTLQRGQPVQVR